MPLNIDAVPESTYVTNPQQKRRGLWLGLLAGPVLYALYFITGYLLTEATCRGALLGIQPASLTGAIAALTVVAGLLTLAATGYAYRNWRRYHGADDATQRALAFMSIGGLLLSLYCALLIGVTGAAVFFLNPCQWS